MELEARVLGRLGEELATRHLRRRGWCILGRNVREGRKEVDIIARRGKILAFVEVKTRRNQNCGHPLASITRRKQSEIREVAGRWLARNPQHVDTVRFDAVGIVVGPAGTVSLEHIPDAWGG